MPLGLSCPIPSNEVTTGSSEGALGANSTNENSLVLDNSSFMPPYSPIKGAFYPHDWMYEDMPKQKVQINKRKKTKKTKKRKKKQEHKQGKTIVLIAFR